MRKDYKLLVALQKFPLTTTWTEPHSLWGKIVWRIGCDFDCDCDRYCDCDWDCDWDCDLAWVVPMVSAMVAFLWPGPGSISRHNTRPAAFHCPAAVLAWSWFHRVVPVDRPPRRPVPVSEWSRWPGPAKGLVLRCILSSACIPFNTHSAFDQENVAVVQILLLGYVGKVPQVLRVLAGAIDVLNLVLANGALLCTNSYKGFPKLH